MIEFCKTATFSGYGEARTPWRKWEDWMDESLLVCDLLQVGEVDHWTCQLETEETYGEFRRAGAPVALTQGGRTMSCVDFENFGRVRLHVRWSVPQLVKVSAVLVPSPRSD